MRAIETTGKIDKKGFLHLVKPVKEKAKQVKVIILFDEKEGDEESVWLASVAKSPSFAFLNHPDEDIYSLSDGKPFND